MSILATAKYAREKGIWVSCGNDGFAGVAFPPGVLECSGPDAEAFLHGQITNEVKGLALGYGNLTARVTRKGTLYRLFTLHKLEGRCLMLLERAQVSGLQADLDKFLFADNAKLEDISARFAWAAVQGPFAPRVLADLYGQGDVNAANEWMNVPEFAARESTLVSGSERIPALIIANSLTGDLGFLIGVPRTESALQVLTEALAKTTDTHGVRELAMPEFLETAEMLRIEAGMLRMGIDVAEGERVLPQMGIEQQAVSYSKGCYLGQEVIARIKTYGSTQFALRGLTLQGDLSDVPPLGADVVLADGSKVGQWGSRTHAPMLDQPVAFAFLDRNRRTPGTKFSVKGSHGEFMAEVVMLPFYRAPDNKARAKYLHHRAVKVFAAGRDADALALLEETLRLDPSFADAYEALGVILGRSSRYHDAIEIFHRLEEVAPDEPMVHTNLSLYYMKIGDKTRAEEEKAKGTLKRFFSFSDAQAAEEREQKEAEARRADAVRTKKMFGEVLEFDPEDPVALFGFGNACATLGDFTSAEQSFGKASTVQPNNSAVYLARGKALEKLQRHADALAVYHQGIVVASRKGDLMPLKDMEHRVFLLESSAKP